MENGKPTDTEERFLELLEVTVCIILCTRQKEMAFLKNF